MGCCISCDVRRALNARAWTVEHLAELVGADAAELTRWLRSRGAPPNADVISRIKETLCLDGNEA
jgi:transcriptional regulator with XRE-family HTH domain